MTLPASQQAAHSSGPVAPPRRWRLLRSMGLGIILFSLLLALLATIGWWQREALLPRLANPLLSANGIQILTLQGLQPDREGMTITRLDLQLEDGSTVRISRLRVDGTVLMLRQGRIGHIDADMISVEQRTPSTTSNNKVAADGFSLAADELLVMLHALASDERLPGVHINQLELAHWPQALQLTLTPGAQQLRLDVSETDSNDDLHASLILHWPSQTPWPLQGEIRLANATSEISASLALQRFEQQQLDTWLNLQLDSQQLDSLLHSLAPRLAHIDVTLPALPASGVLHLQVSGRISEQWPAPHPLPLRIIIGSGSSVSLDADWLNSLIPDLTLDSALQLRWPGVAEINLQLAQETTLSSLSVAGTAFQAAIDGRLQLPDLSISGSHLIAERHTVNCPQLDDCFFALFGDFAAQQVDWLDLQASQPQTESLRVQGQLQDEQLTLTIDRDLRLSLPRISHLGYTMLNAAVVLPEPLQITAALQRLEDMQLRGAAVDIELPVIREQDMMSGLRLRLVALQMQPLPPVTLQAQARLRNLYTNLIPVNLWDALLDVDIDWQDDVLQLESTLRFGDTPWLQASTRYQLSTQTALLHWQIPSLDFDPLLQPLSSMIDPLPMEMDILAGSISGEGSLQWQLHEDSTTWHSDFAITAQDIGGYVGDIGFVDLRTALRGRIVEGLLSTTDIARLGIARVDAGIAVEQIGADFRLHALPLSAQLMATDWRIEVVNLALSVFGGAVASDHLDYHHLADHNTMMLRLDQIDLGQVLSLSAYEGVSASGLMSGELPVTLSGTSLSVSDGRLRALPPGGGIRYRDGPGATGNPALDLMYQALENYNYSSLEADVDYHADGELLLAVRLQGISTEVNQGQRVNLNVNISDNIPDLLASLQAGRNVADAVQLRLQQGRR